eukprot:g6311.t1
MQRRDIRAPDEHSTQFTNHELTILNEYRNCSLAVDTLLTHNNEQIAEEIQKTVPDFCLLQFAALKGDTYALHCLQKLDGVYELGKKDSLFGSMEKSDFMDQPWELRVEKQKPGLTFKMERKYWREGLFLYRTSAVFENCDIHDFKEFILSCNERLRWDWSAEKLFTISPECKTENDAIDLDSCFIFSENKMPCPFSNREYLMARRVWSLKEGGIFAISRSCEHPQAPKPRGRNVRIKDYTTGFLMKEVKSVQGVEGKAVEMSSLYFDNMKISPVAFNLAMSASMWTAIVATDTAYRKFQIRSQGLETTSEETQEMNQPLQQQCEENKTRGKRIWVTLAATVLGVLALKQRKQQSFQFTGERHCSHELDLEKPLKHRLR